MGEEADKGRDRGREARYLHVWVVPHVAVQRQAGELLLVLHIAVGSGEWGG